MAWLIAALALLAAAYVVPGAEVEGFWGALLVALVVAVLNAILPPLSPRSACRSRSSLGFVLVLLANAAMLMIADRLTEGAIQLDSFWDALLVALVAAAVGVVAPGRARGERRRHVQRCKSIRRIARPVGRARRSRRAGDSSSSRSTGSRCRCCERAMRDGNAPNMARWLAEDTHRLAEWETGPLVADGRQPGGHPARLERGHLGVPVGREGDRRR